MKFKLSTNWNCSLFLILVMGSGTAMAQTGSRPVPPISGEYSPWGSPSGEATPSAEGGEGARPAPKEGDSFFVPVKPPSEGFDYFDDEDEPASGSRSRGRSGAEGKSSFKLLERTDKPSCENWGNSLLDTAYGDKTNCEFELEKRVDEGRAWIDELVDKIERTKLKKVIRQELSSRAEAAKYDVKFDTLEKTLLDANAAGCTCLN